MLKNFQLSSLALVLLPAVGFSGKASAVACGGRFPNPVTDICWLCMFPINIGAIKLTMPGQVDNHDVPPPLLCTCPAPPPIFVRLGVGISYVFAYLEWNRFGHFAGASRHESRRRWRTGERFLSSSLVPVPGVVLVGYGDHSGGLHGQ